jgi:NAD(P)-dependent dehydrogenase (short-subunit alcohol dehydrogenase family)
MAPQEWDHVIDVNLSGAFYLSKVILQHMLDRGYGSIINISSAIGSANLDGRCRRLHPSGRERCLARCVVPAHSSRADQVELGTGVHACKARS